MIDVSALEAEFGAHYKAGSANMNNLIDQLYETTETDELFQLMPTDSTVYEASQVEVGSLLQSFQPQFTPNASEIIFTPRATPLARIKMDVSVVPDDVEGEWTGFLGGGKTKIKPVDYPLVAYILQNHLIPKWKEDWELEAVYKGVYSAPVGGTANAPNQVINGIRNQLNVSAALGGQHNTQVIAIGAPDISPSLWVKQVETFWKGIPRKFRRRIKSVNMAPILEERFREGMRDLYNAYYDQTSTSYIYDTKVMVKGLDSMIGSTKIWTSIPENMRRPEKRSVGRNSVRLETNHYNVDFMTNYWKAVAFKYMGYTWSSDQDLI